MLGWLMMVVALTIGSDFLRFVNSVVVFMGEAYEGLLLDLTLRFLLRYES